MGDPIPAKVHQTNASTATPSAVEFHVSLVDRKDLTGEIYRRARQLGFYLRQERERTIVRAVTDADSAAGLKYP